MKKTFQGRCVGLLFAAAMLSLSGGVHAQAANNPNITFNEDGVGSLVFPGGPPFAVPGVLAPDPGPGGLAAALTFNLLGPPSLVAGDVFCSNQAALFRKSSVSTRL